MDVQSSRRNIPLLAVCQALAMTGASVTMTASALVGQMLAIDKSLATVPLAFQMTATMLTTIPASLLMRRLGRRAGFSIGSLFGITSGIVCALAIYLADFWLFVVGSMFMGATMGFATYYRFAAADVADERYRSRAISLVMAGGVAAAIAGPELAKWSAELLAPLSFAGCFAAIAVLHLGALLLLQATRIAPPSAQERRESGRPLKQIARQPVFLVAAFGGMIGYAVMALVMTATPLAMVACGFGFPDAAFVIQWHALGMFAPSFVTGRLINRFGVLNVMATGAALMLACIAVNLSGITMVHFWSALVLLGLGWNFLFIGATTLLTEAYAPAERAKSQALNDFAVFTAVAAASFFSGAVQGRLGWDGVNVAAILPVVAALVAVLWLKARRAGGSAPRLAGTTG